MVRLPSTNSFDQAMLALARIHVDAGQSVRTALNTVARVAITALGIGRFSVWLTNEQGDAVRLYYLHRPDAEDILDGTVLRIEEFPSYFAALSHSRALLVPDTAIDPAVTELRNGYIKPLGIGALLDAPIWRGSELVGIVCHEHIGSARPWQPAEREFAADVAAAVARLFEEGERVRAQDSLLIYQKHLRELSRYEGMGRLAAGVAHDLRNLLHIVGANAEVALERSTDAEARQALEAVLHAVQRSRQLAGNVLQFGQGQVEGPVVLDPAELVQECVMLLSGALDDGQVLEVGRISRGRRIFAPRAELERVLLNLVTNAREAMPDGGRITLSVLEVSDGDPRDDRVVIEIRDSGVGMTIEQLGKARNPFYTTKVEGTGLGLAMADQVMARAGGTLDLLSVPGQGTTVRCVLPRIA